ncbi:MAG: transketolase family protein [Clostridia bacterium]|nr:transketolase family protein [Clostridia bacterium]MBO5206263.1 transketolase family protein [Clostridia bacterium]MBP3582541.1 transketolase family protein [Clostridia bacterium]
MADKKATRESYGAALAELGEKYDFLVLDADLAAATKTGMFKKKFPERFFDCGIAEGNMISVAAGIAATGKKVFATSFAMFAAGRAYEQIRNSIGYPHLNVNIVGTHASITVGEDGATHQCNEDLALMRTIPGMSVICPADATEAYAAVEAALNHDGPCYLRFGRFAVPNLTPELVPDYKFELGKGVTYREGTDVTIVATGYMAHLAVEAADMLAAEGISAGVINIHTIKPLDTELILNAAKKTGAIVTAEEHTVVGGLGAAVCEALSESYPVPVLRVGVEDKYGKSGKVPELLELYGLTAANIAAKAKAAIALKR